MENTKYEHIVSTLAEGGSKYILAVDAGLPTERVIAAETLKQLQDNILFDTLEHECKEEHAK